jgi:hypothetical protein
VVPSKKSVQNITFLTVIQPLLKRVTARTKTRMCDVLSMTESHCRLCSSVKQCLKDWTCKCRLYRYAPFGCFNYDINIEKLR